MGWHPILPGCEARCPGCAHRDLSPSDSAARKQAWLSARLSPWASALKPLREAPPGRRLGYREKTCLRAEWDPVAGRWKLGLLAPALHPVRRDEREVIDIPGCPVHSERIRAIVRLLQAELPGAGELALAFVLVSGALVTLVLKQADEPAGPARKRLLELGSRLSSAGAEGLLLNLNPAAGERVLAPKSWRLLWGARQATVEFRNHPMTYGPDSFQQLIPELYSEALERARAFLAPRPQDRVLDLCSGSGASLRLWREAGSRTLGIELGGESVRCADLNAGPGLTLRGRCSDRLPQAREWAREAQGEGSLLVYANPPRLGLEPEVTGWLAGEARSELGLRRMAYLSCSAGTLARDLGLLEEAGYRIESLQPYDFFPGTHHVETLALLSAPERAA